MLEFNSLFDEKYYLLQNQDVAIAIGQGFFTSGLDHYQRCGQFERRSPSGFFAEDYYLSQNPDVAQAVQAGLFQNGLQHFIGNGQAEGRQSSVFFDPNFYLGFYSDVDTAVANSSLTPLEHFLKNGQFEQRDPISEFYTDTYLAENPDVAQAVQATAATADPLTPIEHFIDYGQYEGRNFGPDFNNSSYLQQNPDVAAAVKPYGLSPIKHYLQFGKNEGRFSTEGPEFNIIDLTQALDLGTIGSTSVSDFVGNNNAVDVYRFNVGNLSTVNITLNGLSADADLLLIQDQNGNGVLDDDEESSEVIDFSGAEGVTEEQISHLLQPGSYFVAVEQFEGDTNYNLSLSATPFTPPADTAGNTLSTARNLGTITNSPTINEFVGNADLDDFYSINLSTNSTLNVNLDNLSADADLYVIQDSNGNGTVEDEEVLAASELAGNTSEQIADLALNAGNYFVRVQQFEGDTTYDLSLSATPADIPPDNAGNSPDKARDIGILSTTQTFSDFVGNVDTDDFYRFTTNGTTDFSLTLDGLTGDADVSLALDKNNNNVIDANEEFEISANEGVTPEAINVTGLPTGTYFVHVYPFAGDTNYNLALSATPSSSTPITIGDPEVPPIPPTPPVPPPPTPPTPDTGGRAPKVEEPRQGDEPRDLNGDKDQKIESTLKSGKEDFVEVTKPADDVSLAALIIGTKWNLADRGKLSYSFVTSETAGSYRGPNNETGIAELSEATKNNIRKILTEVYQPVIPIKFVEIKEDGKNFGSLRFMYSKGPDNAWAYRPGNGNGGDVHLNPKNEENAETSYGGRPGNYGYYTLVHEIGHAMGLSHPGDYNGQSAGGGEGPFLPVDKDNNSNTIMTYNDTKNYPITLMPFDIRALQSFYGANVSYNNTDTTYRIDSDVLQQYKTIWDGGGNDTLDFSALPSDNNGYRFDLNPGGRNTALTAFNKAEYKDAALGIALNNKKITQEEYDKAPSYTADRYGAPIAYGTAIENLIGTQSNDFILGNNVANNINAGAGDDQIFGGGGADVLAGASGADQFTLAVGNGGSTLETAPTIEDFNAGEGDTIGLFNGLNFASLSIIQGTGDFAVIQSNGEFLAKLRNTQASTLTQERFKTV